MQAFTNRLERGEFDLSHTLVHSHSVLVYVSRKWQERFYRACEAAGCKNFHFEEYPQSHTSPEEYFKLNQSDFFACQWPQAHIITEAQKGWWLPVAWFRLAEVEETDIKNSHWYPPAVDA